MKSVDIVTLFLQSPIFSEPKVFGQLKIKVTKVCIFQIWLQLQSLKGWSRHQILYGHSQRINLSLVWCSEYHCKCIYGKITMWLCKGIKLRSRFNMINRVAPLLYVYCHHLTALSQNWGTLYNKSYICYAVHPIWTWTHEGKNTLLVLKHDSYWSLTQKSSLVPQPYI